MKRLHWLPLPLALSALAALAALPGCSGLSGNSSADAGPPPVISSAAFPPTASIGSDGNYDFPGVITFSSTSPVNFIQVVSNALQYSDTLTIEPVTSVHNGSLPLTFPAGSAASGTQADYSITLVDEAGAQSDPYSGTVLLE